MSLGVFYMKGCMQEPRNWLFRPFFSLVQMLSIFACGLNLHRKTYAPILVCWFLFRFSDITYAKTHLFFLAVSFPNRPFVFANNRISKAHICRQGWFRKTCTFACVISWKRTTKQQKNTGQCFLVKSNITCQNLTHFEAPQKNSQKSHLRCSCTRTFN